MQFQLNKAREPIMKLTALGLIAVAALTVPGYSPAAVVYSNLGPGDSFGPGYYMVDPGHVLGFMFRPGATQNIRSFEIPLSKRTPLDPPSLTVTVHIHMVGGSPAFPTVGWLLETFEVPVAGYFPNGGLHALSGANLSGNTRLFDGLKVWVLVEQPTYGFSWFLNNTSQQSMTYYNGWIVARDDQGAFRITSEFIAPEPGSFALLGLGLVGLSLSRRKKAA
jgi:hypothetical protein